MIFTQTSVLMAVLTTIILLPIGWVEHAHAKSSTGKKLVPVNGLDDPMTEAICTGIVMSAESPRLNRLSLGHKFEFRTKLTRSKVTFKSYAPSIFTGLRFHWKVDGSGKDGDESTDAESGYSYSFSSGILLNAGSLAHSGSNFYYTLDHRYIIKTLSSNQFNFLIRQLWTYADHMTQNPESLLTKFLGVYRVELTLTSGMRRTQCSTRLCLFPRRKSTRYYVVMANSLHESQPPLQWLVTDRESLTEIYDMKAFGLMHERDNKDLNRWLISGAQVETSASERLDSIRQQLHRDINFLSDRMGVNDYSLLVGVRKYSAYVPTYSSPEKTLKSMTSSINQNGVKGPASFNSVSRMVTQTIYYFAMIDILSEWHWGRKLGYAVMPGAYLFWPRYMRPKEYKRRMHKTIDVVLTGTRPMDTMTKSLETDAKIE